AMIVAQPVGVSLAAEVNPPAVPSIAPPVPGSSTASPIGGSANPYSPAYEHPYRLGAVPTQSALAQMQAYATQHPGIIDPDAGGPVYYQGSSFGVITGPPKVYLVFWGPTWGGVSVDGNGDLRFTGDPDSGVPMVQEMFRGLGTGGELWSGVM